MSETKHQRYQSYEKQTDEHRKDGKKIFVIKLISAIICFITIKYISCAGFSFSPIFKDKLLNLISYDADINVIYNFTDKLKEILPSSKIY